MPEKKRIPRKPRVKKKVEPPVGKDRAILCARAAEDKKAEEVLVLDISKLSSFTDYFVICSGVGEPHIRAISENVINQMAQAGIRTLGAEGLLEAKWALIDFGDVVVHVFDGETRKYYDLERLWIHAEEVEPPGE